MKLIQTLVIVGMAIGALAEQPQPAPFIKGTIDIKYISRQGTASADDVYLLNINVSDSAIFRGTINNKPLVLGLLNRVSQAASLNYMLECDVVNPANPSQKKLIGRMYGVVPIDINGSYRFGAGSLKVMVNSMGRAQGFESKFGGLAVGKPLYREEGWLSKLKSETMNITKQVQGKTVSIAVKKYDKMKFSQHVLGAGPVQYYAEATVNGEMIYDYDRSVWYFNGVTITYPSDGKQLIDRLTGNIRWVESPQRKTNGEGEYQFDVRLNEPQISESSVFAGPANEAAFFETDDSIPALIGTMKYKDQMQGETVLNSAVVVDLKANKLNRQQCMNLAKLIILSCVVPFNAE